MAGQSADETPADLILAIPFPRRAPGAPLTIATVEALRMRESTGVV